MGATWLSALVIQAKVCQGMYGWLIDSQHMQITQSSFEIKSVVLIHLLP